jgi:hypothetical protein
MDKVQNKPNSSVQYTPSSEYFQVYPEGKRLLERPKRTWEYKIKIDLRGIGWGGMDWIDLVQDVDQCGIFVNTIMNLRVP